MRTRADLAVAMLTSARGTVTRNVAGLTLDDALQAAGGYRSVIGLLKHVAAWTHVYHSYAFDAAPRHWRAIAWPRGLRDTIDASQAYLDEVIAWYSEGADLWAASLAAQPDAAFDEQRACHWGATAPLWEILLMVTDHWSYHAGEINGILAVARREAWEYTEEVEENHISTAGHRVRPNWMSDAQAAQYEAYIAVRDTKLRAE